MPGSLDDATTKAALEIVRHELDYRRKKQWDIFYWTVTLLVAVIGGTVALASKGSFKFDILSRALMAASIAVISLYAVRWIDNNLKFERKARRKLLELVNTAGLDNAVADPDKFEFGYATTVRLVAVGAVLTILLVPIKDWPTVWVLLSVI